MTTNLAQVKSQLERIEKLLQDLITRSEEHTSELQSR